MQQQRRAYSQRLKSTRGVWQGCEVDFATGMTLVDNDTLSTPLSAELQNNQVLSLTETRITYTEED